MVQYDFSGQVAVISGAASGMGLLFCRCYVEMGGSVVMTDISKEALDAAVCEINTIRASSAIGVVCDVRDYEQICRVRDEAVRVFGRIDLLIPFAGGAETRMLKVTPGLEFPDIPIDVYDWSLEVNLRGQLYFDHAVLKQMREQKSGTILHIGSITGEEGCGSNVGYATSKSAAMNGLTKSIAKYGAKYGIRCNCVSPGPVLTRAAMANMKTLMGRAAEPQEIVDMLLYLASPKGAFITGINILMDGGRNLL
ncbi:MAG: SDR family oxidoreductase [Clostridia bacterium]|nr:SDR family oxidoreductase [Clostridia bacterium]